MTLLSVESIAVHYGGVPAVRDVSFAVEPGQVVALLGANGAGKTSTLRAISGLEPLRAGKVSFAGVSLAGCRAESIAREGISHVPAGRGIFGSLSVEENLAMARYAAGRPASEGSQAIFDVFPILSEKRAVPAGTLSGGQQQQLAIGRALAQHPRLLMVDEMSMGLSPTVVTDLFAIVAGLRERGIAVLMVEQFVTEALKIADRAVIMEQGQVVASGLPSELAADQLAAAYLGGSHEVTTSEGAKGPAHARLGIDSAGRAARALQRRADELGVSVGDLVTRTRKEGGDE